jgi:hypothetical protein
MRHMHPLPVSPMSATWPMQNNLVDLINLTMNVKSTIYVAPHFAFFCRVFVLPILSKNILKALFFYAAVLIFTFLDS